MGLVIRVQADMGGRTSALDVFNRSNTPPPSIISRIDLSFSAKDLTLLAA